MKRFLISPPFGNWIGHEACTRVLGSFTLDRRPGLLYHTMRSLRPVAGGWINQIGLRNRGIRNVTIKREHIYSLVGLKDGDWEEMIAYVPANTTVEINLGCRNVHRYGIPYSTLLDYCRLYEVIGKLSPTDEVDDQAAMCVEGGTNYLHLSNTVPTPHGGISGRQAFEKNLPIVERLAARYPQITIIAGGGIYNRDVLNRYAQAGAQHFSLATIWFTPWRVPSVLNAA